MARHLAALIVGQRLAQGCHDGIELGAECFEGGLGRGVVHLGQQHQARRALHQHPNGGAVGGATDQVAFPVAGHDAILDLGRAHVDADHLGKPPAPVLARRAALARALALAEASDQLPAQLAAGVGVDGGVDRLVRDLHRAVVGPHAPKCGGDLLRRPTPRQARRDRHPEPAVRVQLGPAPRRRTPCARGLLGWRGGVADARHRVAPQLAADRAGRAPQRAGDGTHAASLLPQARDRHPVLGLKVLVLRCRHEQTYLLPTCCSSTLRPPSNRKRPLVSARTRRPRKVSVREGPALPLEEAKAAQ